MLLYVKSYLGADFWKNEELATSSSTQLFASPGVNHENFHKPSQPTMAPDRLGLSTYRVSWCLGRDLKPYLELY